MKNICLIFLLLLGIRGWTQGDVIFMVDASSSIQDNPEYADMQNSIADIMDQVLECHPDNRVTVVQYAGNSVGPVPRIWIESNFTSTAFTFVRKPFATMGIGDYAHECLGMIGNALDGVPNANILSPITTLTQTPGNSLVIFLFTDALRALGSSYLVNFASPAVGTNGAFQNYRNFKTARGASFVVMIVPPNAPQDVPAIQAAATIASGGGSYTGAVEGYPLDPDAAATSRRLVQGGFALTPAELSIIIEDICTVIGPPECIPNLTLTHPPHDVTPPVQDNRAVSNEITASNWVPNNGVGVYHAEVAITLTSGFYSASGSRFRAYITDCEDDFQGRMADPNPDAAEKLRIWPNPASDQIRITAPSDIHEIAIARMDGTEVFRARSVSSSEYGIEVSRLPKGIYILRVTTSDGKQYIEKVVKN